MNNLRRSVARTAAILAMGALAACGRPVEGDAPPAAEYRGTPEPAPSAPPLHEPLDGAVPSLLEPEPALPGAPQFEDREPPQQPRANRAPTVWVA